MELKNQERRRHRRYIANSEAELFAFSVETPRFIGKGLVTDISFGGLRFESNFEFEQEDILLKFYLPGDRKLFAVRCRKVRTGKEPTRLIYGLKIYEALFTEKIRLWLYLFTHKNTLN